MNPSPPVLTVPLSAKNEAATARLESLARILGEGVTPPESYESRASVSLARASDFLSKQGEKLVKLAAEQKAILPADVFKNIQPISEDTAEVIVYQKKDRVHKVTRGVNFFGYTIFCYDHKSMRPSFSKFDAAPSEYFQRLAWANRIFGTDNRFEGVAVDQAGNPQIVTSQRYVPPEKEGWLKQYEIEGFMAQKGFRQLRLYNYSWYRPADGILVHDTHSGNLRRTEKGEIFPIDLIINKIDPEKLRKSGWNMSMSSEYKAPETPLFPGIIPGLRWLNLRRHASEGDAEIIRARLAEIQRG